MDVLESVIDLIKERDELSEEVETYEEWFESLVGKRVVLTTGKKKHKRFVECDVKDFVPGEGWELESLDGDPETFIVSFADFVEGRVYVRDDGEPHVTFVDDE